MLVWPHLNPTKHRANFTNEVDIDAIPSVRRCVGIAVGKAAEGGARIEEQHESAGRLDYQTPSPKASKHSQNPTSARQQRSSRCFS
jgi:hypothetical protein